jgi:D-lactate dehydrogenase (cytochrome)
MLPSNVEEYDIGKDIYRQICELAIKLNGTISAEHGVGKLKTEYLKMMYGEDNIRKMAEIKRAFDPNLQLGRGTLFQI